MTIRDINTKSLEGRLLMAAMAMLTTEESRKTRTPDDVLSEINTLREKMYNETQGQLNAEAKSTLFTMFYVTVYVLCSCFVSGFVFMKMWTWFVVRAFNAPDLQFAVCVGLYFFVKTLIGVATVGDSKIEKDAKRREDLQQFFIDYGKRTAMSAIILLAAYLLHLIVR